MRCANFFYLPGTGRGTSRRLVEGFAGVSNPSTPALARGGPPPRDGEVF